MDKSHKVSYFSLWMGSDLPLVKTGGHSVLLQLIYIYTTLKDGVSSQRF